MSAKILRPGGASGIMQILANDYGVPLLPTLSRQDVALRLKQEIRSKGLEKPALRLSDQPVTRGTLFDASGARVVFPEGPQYDRTFVALVDPEPLTRWGHLAYWVWIPAEHEDAKIIWRETQLPEHHSGPVRMLELQ